MRKKMEMFNFVLDSFKRGIFDFKVKRQDLIAGTVIGIIPAINQLNTFIMLLVAD